jgi:hypothetical protein
MEAVVRRGAVIAIVVLAAMGASASASEILGGGVAGFRVQNQHEPLTIVERSKPTGPATEDGHSVKGRSYASHRSIVATTFWVGEVFDPSASDGSQVISTYDSKWMEHYGGCDGVVRSGRCETEPRTAANDYFPSSIKPKQNPFYLDLPFDDINNTKARGQRATVIPWAGDQGYSGREHDDHFSYMKNRWVLLSRGNRVCYGQIEDAGPGRYDDAAYVFGSDDRRPASTKFNRAGLDISPALNGCLGMPQLNADLDTVDWSFVDDVDVPAGPWTKIMTAEQVTTE